MLDSRISQESSRSNPAVPFSYSLFAPQHSPYSQAQSQSQTDAGHKFCISVRNGPWLARYLPREAQGRNTHRVVPIRTLRFGKLLEILCSTTGITLQLDGLATNTHSASGKSTAVGGFLALFEYCLPYDVELSLGEGAFHADPAADDTLYPINSQSRVHRWQGLRVESLVGYGNILKANQRHVS